MIFGQTMSAGEHYGIAMGALVGAVSIRDEKALETAILSLGKAVDRIIREVREENPQ